MFLKHLKKGSFLALLFLFMGSPSYAADFYYQQNTQAYPACNADITANGFTGYCTNSVAEQRYYFTSCTVNYTNGNPSLTQKVGTLECPDDTASWWYTKNYTNSHWYTGCPEGSTADENGLCSTPPPQLNENCSERGPIVADAGGSDFSYQGCNYEKCGSITDADNGTYNEAYCSQPTVCADTLLGCFPENQNPYSTDLDEGCASFGGKSVCVDEDDPDNCYTVDGVQTCFKENSICGTSNGSFQCLQPDEDNCGLFNGKTTCFKQNPETGAPEVIDPDSPDHPDNGGNSDGDDTNDVTDSRAVVDGGDANNQPTDNKLSSDQRKQAKLDAEYMVNEQLKKGLWESLPSDNSIVDGVSSEADLLSDGLLSQGQDVINGVVSGGDGFGESSALTSAQNSITGAINVGGGCASLPIVVPAIGTFNVDCFYLDKVKQFLSFLFYILTLFTLFRILTTPLEGR